MAIYYRVGDTLPPLRVEVQDLGEPIDITNLQVMVTWVKPDGSLIAEKEALPADLIGGLTDYEWVAGDLSIEGPYQAMVRLKDVSGAYYSLTDPPILEIEVLPNPPDSASSILDDLVPFISSYDVAVHLRIPLADLNATYAQSSISRARSLAFVLAQMWRLTAPLGARDQWLAKELVSMLAAREYILNPAIIYGPFKKEAIGSYEYQLKDSLKPGQGLTGNGDIDGILDYFLQLGVSRFAGIDVIYPDWYQPATTQIWDPMDPRGGVVDPNNMGSF